MGRHYTRRTINNTVKGVHSWNATNNNVMIVMISIDDRHTTSPLL